MGIRVMEISGCCSKGHKNGEVRAVGCRPYIQRSESMFEVVVEYGCRSRCRSKYLVEERPAVARSGSNEWAVRSL